MNSKHQQLETIALSVNEKIINRPEVWSKFNHCKGFQAKTLTLERMINAIKSGYMISYQFYREYTDTVNFIKTGYLAVDVDKGMTLVEAFAHEKVKEFASFIYTTCRHTQENHRFRIVFVLEREINDALELKHAATALTRMFGGDMSAVDAARKWAGNTNAEIYRLGNILSNEFLDQLIADGSTPIPESNSQYDGSSSSSVRSNFKIPRDEVFHTGDGRNILISEVVKTTAVHCKYHDDKKTSAFIAVSANGGTFLRCSACKVTRWMDATAPSSHDEHDFDVFAKDVEDFYVNSSSLFPVESPMTQRFIKANVRDVIVKNNKNLNLHTINEGFTLIKSPKGSGKTTFLKTQFDQKAPFSLGKVLLIGHRKSLLNEISSKLGINCYLNKDLADKATRKNRYAVSVDSLYKEVHDLNYETIIIDEIEQVLTHFSSETLGNKAVLLFDEFSRIIKNAKYVVVLDADLGYITFDVLSSINQDRADPKSIDIFINEYQVQNKTLNFYGSKHQMLGVLEKNIAAGKRVYVSSNSKSFIDTLYKTYGSYKNTSGDEVKLISVTSDTVKARDTKKETEKFMSDVKTEILNYDLVLASPSMGTGIDITFANEDQEIDAVFGFYDNQITTHTSCDQSLMRVRHPKETNVWLSGQWFTYETDYSVLQQDILESPNFYKRTGCENLINLFALTASFENASKNSLKKNFLRHKTNAGYTINYVKADETVKALGKKIFNDAKNMELEDKISCLLDAEILSSDDYSDLQMEEEFDSFKDNPKLYFSFLATKLKNFYGQDLTRELIIQDDNGNFMEKVNNFISITSPESLKDIDAYLEGNPDLVYEKFSYSEILNLHKKSLLYKIFDSTPFFHDGEFDANVKYTSTELVEFIALCKKYKKEILIHWKISLRSDLDKKPVSQLGQFLKLIGIKTKNLKPIHGANQTKIYSYRLNPDSLLELTEICRRKSINTNVN